MTELKEKNAIELLEQIRVWARGAECSDPENCDERRPQSICLRCRILSALAGIVSHATKDDPMTPLEDLIAKWRASAIEWQRGIGDNQNTRLYNECSYELTVAASVMAAELAAARAALQAEKVISQEHFDYYMEACRSQAALAGIVCQQQEKGE